MTERQAADSWPHLVVRATGRTWVRSLIVLAAVVALGAAGLIADIVAPGIATAITGAVMLAAFAGVVICLAAITVRWRTSVRCDGANLVLRDPLGARVVPLHAGLGIVRWLDPRTQKPVLWVADRGALLAPLSPLLSPLKLEGFAHALGLGVVDVDGPPSR